MWPLTPCQIWVNSPHTASGYYTIYGEESLQADHFNTKLSFGDPQTLWARTGYLGFVKRTELTDASGGEILIGFRSVNLLTYTLKYALIPASVAVSICAVSHC